MNTAQKVREHKTTWPELYCTAKVCLWRVKHNGRPDTPCPRHAERVAPLPDSPACDDPGAHRHGCQCNGGEPRL
jgi:hypothetical protein